MELGRWIMNLAPELPLWINGRLDIALALGVGFHGGEDYPDLPPLCPISRPLHRVEQLQGRTNADQLLISPVFKVPGKSKPLGIAGLHEIINNMPPWRGKLLALGGINYKNVAELQHHRLDGVALIRGIWDSDDPSDMVGQLRSAWVSS